MLTPAFEVSQDAGTIKVVIKAPFAKIFDAEIYIDGCEFKFYSKPYYLRLNLPGEIVEDGRESATYDSEKGYFTITVPKATPGEHFEGLDMLTRLLAPVGRSSAKAPQIEVIDSGDAPQEEEGAVEEEEEDIDWQIEQDVYEEDSVTLNDPKYGFASQRSGVFKRLQHELHDVIDLRDADSIPSAKRSKLRIEHEDAHFDEDYYLADLYNDEVIQQVLSYRPPWVDEYNKVKAGISPEDAVDLTDDLKERMLKLPRKEYLLDKPTRKEVLLGLVDLIFSYAYNHRTTEGDYTVESSWTVTKLSTMLSWLETPISVRDGVIASTRRSLCYPLYRNWELAKRVLKDTQRIFITGRRCTLRCLLEMHALLIDTDSRYILNDLYVTDYCVWIQSVSDKHLRSLAKTLAEVKIHKKDVGFDLELLEHAAALTLEENSHQDASPSDLTSGLQNLSLQSDSTDKQKTPETQQINQKEHHEGNLNECHGESSGLSQPTPPCQGTTSESEYETDSESDSGSYCSSVSSSEEAESQPDKGQNDSGDQSKRTAETFTPQGSPRKVLIEDITENT